MKSLRPFIVFVIILIMPMHVYPMFGRIKSIWNTVATETQEFLDELLDSDYENDSPVTDPIKNPAVENMMQVLQINNYREVNPVNVDQLFCEVTPTEHDEFFWYVMAFFAYWMIQQKTNSHLPRHETLSISSNSSLPDLTSVSNHSRANIAKPVLKRRILGSLAGKNLLTAQAFNDSLKSCDTSLASSQDELLGLVSSSQFQNIQDDDEYGAGSESDPKKIIHPKKKTPSPSIVDNDWVLIPSSSRLRSSRL